VSAPKAPETLRQARRFDAYSMEARRAGLCRVCAPRYAYGRRDGFSIVHPPCSDCLAVMASWPVAAVNGWRKGATRRAGGAPVPFSAPPGVPGTVVLLAVTDSERAA
jgi:hypothetical protein